jgi:CRISPR-associated protein Cmr4
VADRSQSALLFSDAQLLCMPVVSYVGDFAWITSPLALARFSRERRFCGAKPEPPAAIPRCASGVEVSVAQSTLLHDKAVFFRDVKLPAIESADALKWASVIAAEVFGRPNHGANGAGGYSFHDAFVARFAIVSDADFLMFSQSGTDVRTRNRLDDNKQVMDGQLWSEESMPAESIFWGTVVADAIDLSPDGGRDATKPSEWMESFSNGLKVGPQCDAARVVQFGGKASVGRGQCRFILGGVQHG